MRLRATLVAGAAFVTVFVGAATLASAVDTHARSWKFDVYLDDSRIGSHDFLLEETANGVKRLTAEARFDVKFLFINAFKYRHEVEETWSGDCLTGVEARTSTNGKRTEIVGELTEAGFTVEGGSSVSTLDECVMTFAYWNPAFLEQARLLNPQTGEFLEVEVDSLGKQPLTRDGRSVLAEVYRVSAKNMEVRVWYSADAEWLALESPTESGRIIRYELNT